MTLGTSGMPQANSALINSLGVSASCRVISLNSSISSSCGSVPAQALSTGAIVWDNLGMLCLGWPGFLMLGPELETLVRVDLGWAQTLAAPFINNASCDFTSLSSLSHYKWEPVAFPFLKEWKRDFPGDPVAKTLCSQCRGPGVWSLVRELDPIYWN